MPVRTLSSLLSMLNLARYDFLFAVVVGFTWLVMRAGKRRRLPYPPGPKRLPVIGNLFSMPSQEEIGRAHV